MGLGIFSLKDLKQQVRKTGGEIGGEEKARKKSLRTSVSAVFKPVGALFTRNRVYHFSQASSTTQRVANHSEDSFVFLVGIYIYLAF